MGTGAYPQLTCFVKHCRENVESTPKKRQFYIMIPHVPIPGLQVINSSPTCFLPPPSRPYTAPLPRSERLFGSKTQTSQCLVCKHVQHLLPEDRHISQTAIPSTQQQFQDAPRTRTFLDMEHPGPWGLHSWKELLHGHGGFSSMVRTTWI